MTKSCFNCFFGTTDLYSGPCMPCIQKGPSNFDLWKPLDYSPEEKLDTTIVSKEEQDDNAPR